MELLILSVNGQAGFSLKQNHPQLQHNPLIPQSGTSGQQSTTPVSTPRPSAPSPDPSAPARTPPTSSNVNTTPPTPSDQQTQQNQQPRTLDSDIDTILADKSDETWGMTLSYGLNNPCGPAAFNPALASGYLLRRSGISDFQGRASLSISIVRAPPRRLDILLQEALRAYRDLSNLSRVRGIHDAQGNLPLPWHIATAIKGQQILSRTL